VKRETKSHVATEYKGEADGIPIHRGTTRVVRDGESKERRKPRPETLDRVPSRAVKSAHGRFGACEWPYSGKCLPTETSRARLNSWSWSWSVGRSTNIWAKCVTLLSYTPFCCMSCPSSPPRTSQTSAPASKITAENPPPLSHERVSDDDYPPREVPPHPPNNRAGDLPTPTCTYVDPILDMVHANPSYPCPRAARHLCGR
jgi:hypothetical protein